MNDLQIKLKMTCALSKCAIVVMMFLTAFSSYAGDRKPDPNNWGDFYVYQNDNGKVIIRVLASNDQGCNDIWDYMTIKYVTSNGQSHSLMKLQDNSFSGASVLKDPNDNIYHYYKGLNGNNVTRKSYTDTDGSDFYIEFTWHNPPSNLRRKNNFYIVGLWRACGNDWIGDWRSGTASNSPWRRTCYLLDGGLTNKYDTDKKMDIQRFWAPRVFHDTRNDTYRIKYIFTFYSYPFYWQQEIFGPANFDNDWNAKNNWENNSGQKIVPKSYAYSSFVETSTHYFIGYQFFHPTDDSIHPEDRHENDLEDVYVCVKKGSANGGFGTFEGMATNSHGDYKLYPKGQVKLALGHHPQIYITSNGLGVPLGWSNDHGHSIYGYNGTYGKDFPDFAGGDGIVFNISDQADHIQSNPVMKGRDHPFIPQIRVKYPVQGYYDLLDIDELWSLRETTNHNPFMSYGSFGGEGSDGKGPGAHAPWTENDKIFTHPAEFFNSKMGVGASTNYVYNPYRKGGDRANKGPEVSRSLRGDLPSGWSEKVISNNRSVSYYTHEELTVSGKGTGSNDFHYHYRNSPSSAGKVQLIAKVDRVRQNISSNSYTGIRAAAGTNSSNPYIAIFQKPNGYVVLQYRTQSSGSITTKNVGGDSRYKYFKLNRDGNKWYAFYSYNKSNWVYAGSATIDADTHKVGVYLEPNVSGKKASVSFNNIDYKSTPNFTPPSDPDPGDDDDDNSGGGGGSPIGPIKPIDGDHPFEMYMMTYPNPSDGTGFNVQLHKKEASDKVILNVYSLNGERIYQREYDDNQTKTIIEVRNVSLKPGVYFIEAISGNEIGVNRLMIE